MTSEVIVSETEDKQNTSSRFEEPKKQHTLIRQVATTGKKAWVLRIIFLFTLIFLMSSNIIVALRINDPLVIYSTLMPIQSIAIFFITRGLVELI